MKIYNEVVSRFNETTGLWETISEDSFEYSGEVSLAQGVLPSNASAIASSGLIEPSVTISIRSRSLVDPPSATAVSSMVKLTLCIGMKTASI